MLYEAGPRIIRVGSRSRCETCAELQCGEDTSDAEQAGIMAQHHRVPLDDRSNEALYTSLSELFPFNFRKGGGCITRIVLLEQFPSGSFVCGGGIGRDVYRFANGDQRPNIRCQLF